MTSDSVERVRRGYEAWNRTGDVDSILNELDPDVQICVPGDALDYAGVVFHGHQGARDALAVLTGAWRETRFEPLELLKDGDRVLAICRQRSRGLQSDLGVEQTVAHLWSVGTDGKLIRLELFFDPGQARERLLDSKR